MVDQLGHGGLALGEAADDPEPVHVGQRLVDEADRAQVVRLVDDRRDGRADAGGGGAQGKGSGCGRRDDPGVGSMAVYINMH